MQLKADGKEGDVSETIQAALCRGNLVKHCCRYIFYGIFKAGDRYCLWIRLCGIGSGFDDFNMVPVVLFNWNNKNIWMICETRQNM